MKTLQKNLFSVSIALIVVALLCTALVLVFNSNSVFAEETAQNASSTSSNPISAKAIAAGIAVAVAAGAGAISMGIAIAKSVESMARQPEVKNDIRSSMMLGLVFIETAIIYALIVAILLIFVL